MADLVIRKKDIENLGRKTMKEVYEFLHDDYFLRTFEEMKLEQKRLEICLVNSYLRMIYKFDVNHHDKELEYDNYLKELVAKIEDKSKHDNYLKELVAKIEDKSKHDNYLKELVAKIEDESLDISLIYKVLKSIKLDFEINEDLFVKNKAFIYFYSIYYFYDYYLKE